MLLIIIILAKSIRREIDLFVIISIMMGNLTHRPLLIPFAMRSHAEGERERERVEIVGVWRSIAF